MENNENNSSMDKTDELIEDREQQKKLVHPYRKYQIYYLIIYIINNIHMYIISSK